MVEENIEHDEEPKIIIIATTTVSKFQGNFICNKRNVIIASTLSPLFFFILHKRNKKGGIY